MVVVSTSSLLPIEVGPSPRNNIKVEHFFCGTKKGKKKLKIKFALFPSRIQRLAATIMTSRTEWARQRMRRMTRSKSRNRLMETSFDSKTFSSSEDLDEVDRLANHPVLRTTNLTLLERNRLRKSRSESGDFLCRGQGSLSVWTGDFNSSVSNQCSPTGYSLPRSKGMIFNPKLSRSTTVSVHLAAASSNNSHQAAAPPSPEPSITSEASSNWVFQKSQNLVAKAEAPSPVKSSASSTHYVIKAVIENATTPTVNKTFAQSPDTNANLHRSTNLGKSKSTPPNSVPLPNKFSHHIPQNLLKYQGPADKRGQEEEEEEEEMAPQDSSWGSNNEMSTSSSPIPPPPSKVRSDRKKFLPLRSRLKPGGDDSSSADSTPQRGVRGNCDVKRGAESKPLILAPKPVIDLALKQRQKYLSHTGVGDSSNCSSAVSSLESIWSNASDGVHSLISTESRAVSSMSSQSSDVSSSVIRASFEMRSSSNKVSKFQILSPISDKSQEQYSDQQSEQSKTPKISPNDNDNNNINNNMDCVPWDMPKLRMRMLNNLNNDLKDTNCPQGSDSGISIESQSDEIKELLNVPWDMPKLRKKTLGQSRPHSMPTYNLANERSSGVDMSKSHDQQASVVDTNGYNDSLNIPPPPPGFEDSGDEFYLSQTNPDSPLRNAKKQRPRMTLSFGVNPSVKTLMFATNSPFSLNECEEIDPNLPLDRQEWYHGYISRTEAENILRSHKEGSYLVRNVDTSRQEFAMSLKSSKGFMHMRIKRHPLRRDFQLSDFDKHFMSVPQMVHHYTRNRLPIKGAEHMCLKKPIREQLL